MDPWERQRVDAAMSAFCVVAAQEKAMEGGSEALWRQTVSWLRERGHRVSVSLPEDGASVSPGLNARVRKSVCEPFLQRFLRKITKHSWNPIENEVRWIASGRPDLVVISQPGFREGAEWAVRLANLGVPYVLVAHNIHPQLWVGPRSAPEIARAYQGAQRAFFAADSIRILLEDMLGTEIPHAEVVRNPFNVRYRPEMAWPPSGEGLRLAQVSRLDPSAKGQDLSIRVLAQDKWKNRPVTLDFFGEGEHRSGLEALARRLGADAVRFCGHTPDVESIWHTHHALLMPSRFEGLPLALVEAMLCSRVPIATAVGGIPELIEDGLTGFLAAAATESSVDQTLERAWERRGDWEQIGKSAAHRVREVIPENPVQVFGEKLEMIAAGRCGKAL